MSTLKLSNLLIGSDNPQRLVDFYTKVLGQPDMSEGGYTGWSAGGFGLTVAEHSEVHGQNATPGRIIFFFETADVKAEFDRVKGTGATVIREPYAMEENFWIATLADPDGNYFQLATPMPVAAKT